MSPAYWRCHPINAKAMEGYSSISVSNAIDLLRNFTKLINLNLA